MTAEVCRRELKTGRPLLFDGQPPSFDILIQATFPLQSAGMIRDPRNTGQIWVFLLNRGAQRRRRNGSAERVALKASVEVVVLRCTAIDTETGANHRLRV